MSMVKEIIVRVGWPTWLCFFGPTLIVLSNLLDGCFSKANRSDGSATQPIIGSLHLVVCLGLLVYCAYGNIKREHACEKKSVMRESLQESKCALEVLKIRNEGL